MASSVLVDKIYLFTARKELAFYFEKYFRGKLPVCLYSCLKFLTADAFYKDRFFIDPKLTDNKTLRQLIPESIAKKIFFVMFQSEVLPFLLATGLPESSVLPVPCDDDILISRHITFKGFCIKKIKEISPIEKSILNEINGQSTYIQKLKQELLLAARTDLPVLLTGESGTGKSFSAECIHRLSTRRDSTFHVIDMGTFPENLADSTLFGCVRGSYTGAVNSEGLLLQARNGTLFFDEISNAPLSVQAKLLRFLETGLFRSVGASKEQKINSRLIFATNEDLHTLIQQKKFRADLYNRINVLHIRIPPLREHKEDIITLAQHFLKKHACSITQKAAADLESYSWPANIRQLKQCLSRAVLVCQNKCIEADDLIFDYE